MNNFVTVKLRVPINKVRPNPWNPNYMTPSQFEKEKKSIEQLGMIGSIFVGEYGDDYMILDGEHRWKVLKELGYTEIDVENIGSVNESQIQFYTVHMNNTRGQDDVIKRAALLSAMEEGQLQLLPFSEEQIANERKLVEFDFSQYDTGAEIKERKFAQLVVLQLTSEESKVWQQVKKMLIDRYKIDKDDTKKRQDVQTVMYMIKNFLGVSLGSEPGQTVFTIEA